MMGFDFKDKVAVVTGATRGIGRAIAENLFHCGARVIITGTGQIPSWAGGLEGIEFHQVDLLKEDRLNAFVQKLQAEPKIDVLINNAGIHCPEIIDEVSDENWRDIMRVNVEAPMALIRAVSKGMRKHQAGRIVNIASIAGMISKPTSTAYSASKNGLIGLTRACALSLAKDAVLVNALCPGYTDTDMMQRMVREEQQRRLIESIPLKRFAEPQEIANFVLFLASEWNTYINGQTIVIDGGVLAQ